MTDKNSEEVETDVNLGFVEYSKSWRLTSRFFPSKIGFQPAWLAFSESIPCAEDLVCSECHKIKIFLCQLYAPITEKETCFHRSLYIFICKTENCLKENCNKGFSVFRNQLKRKNNYYPFEPPIEKKRWRPDICAESFGIKLCYVCGIRSRDLCGSCLAVAYCSKEHQAYHWHFCHKALCKDQPNGSIPGLISHKLFPHCEIVVQSECCSQDEDNEDTSLDSVTVNEGSLQDVACEEELSKLALSEEDKNFVQFRKTIEDAPDQVIRYDRGGTPLWVSDHNIPSLLEIPNCKYCDGKRIFEFQILPQFLNSLGLDVTKSSLDWGTLVIYTCENSCNDGPDYKEEWLLKQDYRK